jgi:hypothetical protein
MGEDTEFGAGSIEQGEDKGELEALAEGAFVPEEHALHRAEAHDDAGERGGDGDFEKKRGELLLV